MLTGDHCRQPIENRKLAQKHPGGEGATVRVRTGRMSDEIDRPHACQFVLGQCPSTQATTLNRPRRGGPASPIALFSGPCHVGNRDKPCPLCDILGVYHQSHKSITLIPGPTGSKLYSAFLRFSPLSQYELPPRTFKTAAQSESETMVDLMIVVAFIGAVVAPAIFAVRADTKVTRR